MDEILELSHIHKYFEQGTVNETHALKGIDLTLAAGDFVTIIGGNGAGKSTLMNTISGAYRPEEGQIKISGQDVTKWSTHKRAKLVSYVFQDTRMGTAGRLTIEENMALANKRGMTRSLSKGVKAKDRDLMRDQLSRLGLGLEDRLTTDMAFLSGGQRQAVTLLMASLKRPDLLLLDEHTAALDPKTSDMVLKITQEMIEDNGLTTLMITHNMQQALSMGNRLIMLHQGRIILDLDQEQKKGMSVKDLMEVFHQAAGEDLVSDEMLLST